MMSNKYKWFISTLKKMDQASLLIDVCTILDNELNNLTFTKLEIPILILLASTSKELAKRFINLRKLVVPLAQGQGPELLNTVGNEFSSDDMGLLLNSYDNRVIMTTIDREHLIGRAVKFGYIIWAGYHYQSLYDDNSVVTSRINTDLIINYDRPLTDNIDMIIYSIRLLQNLDKPKKDYKEIEDEFEKYLIERDLIRSRSNN